MPPRALDAPATRLADAELWHHAEESPGEVVIGLKRARRGAGRVAGQVLVSTAETRRAERAVLGTSGVSLIEATGDLPMMAVKLDDIGALSRGPPAPRGRLRRAAATY